MLTTFRGAMCSECEFAANLRYDGWGGALFPMQNCAMSLDITLFPLIKL